MFSFFYSPIKHFLIPFVFQESWEEQSYGSQSNSNVNVSAPKNIPTGKAPPSYKKTESSEITPRRNLPLPLPVNVERNNAPYRNLQDAPSPSGRLGDRILRLRQRCISALGEVAFTNAYNFLKSHVS